MTNFTDLTGELTGVERIRRAFARAQAQGRAALMPYYTLGYPDLPRSEAAVQAIIAAGADLVELGMPFSDPLADGPTIQRSTQAALAAGATMRACLDIVRRLRAHGAAVPLLLMGYLNPLLRYGAVQFVEDAARAGADGLILPDLPPEEADAIERACRGCGLALVYLVSPASTPERLRLIASRAQGFIYLVSVLGVTGQRAELAAGLDGFVQRVRAVSDLPLAVGFGVSTPGQAAQVGRLAQGVIVGSALIQAASREEDDPAPACAAFVKEMRAAL